jgi:transglutaminase-like putative cysteine protease
MNYRIQHVTTYQYAAGAEACHNVCRLQPRDLLRQQCLEMTLRIEPAPATRHDYDDYFGNRVFSFAVYGPHSELTIAAESLVKLDEADSDEKKRAMSDATSWEAVRGQLRRDRSPHVVAALDYVFASPYIQPSAAVREFAVGFFPAGKPLAEAALDMTRAIYADFRYDPRATTVGTSVDTVLEKRRGVCQDFAHLQIACLRSQGLACRYVSGYLRTDPQPGKPRLVGADASHAWVSVYCPRHGWIDLDPTNGCLAGPRHVTIGWGRDFHDVSPVKGVVLGGGHSVLRVAVDVMPV